VGSAPATSQDSQPPEVAGPRGSEMAGNASAAPAAAKDLPGLYNDDSPTSVLDQVREMVLLQLQEADEAAVSTPAVAPPPDPALSSSAGPTPWLWLETAIKPTRRSKAFQTDNVDTITKCTTPESLMMRHMTQSPSCYLGQADPTRNGLVPCVTLYREGTAPTLEDPCYEGAAMEWWTALDASLCVQLDDAWLCIAVALCSGDLRGVPCARVVDSPHNRKRRIEVRCCQSEATEVHEQLVNLLRERAPQITWQVRLNGGAGGKGGGGKGAGRFSPSQWLASMGRGKGGSRVEERPPSSGGRAGGDGFLGGRGGLSGSISSSQQRPQA